MPLGSAPKMLRILAIRVMGPLEVVALRKVMMESYTTSNPAIGPTMQGGVGL